MSIKVLPPDVNESEADFTPVGTDIRFGLTAIRNVGSNVVDAIVAARREKGRFTDFADFMDKVPPLVCNKRVIESLIKAGAFDSLGHRPPRAGRRSTRPPSTSTSTSSATRRSARTRCSAGSTTTPTAASGSAIAVPDIAEWDKQTLLGHEREMLGLYVSDHPLMGLEHVLANAADCTIGQLLADEDRRRRLARSPSPA